jgi:hypothetical protein
MSAHSTNLNAPAFALGAKLSPGAYMRQCRRRAGKTIVQCGNELAVQVHDRSRARRDLARLEHDKPGDYGRLATMLRDRKVFAFDFGTFARLAQATADPSLDEWADI